MKLLITGVCGFVGSTLAESLLSRIEGLSLVGVDNLMRPGSEINRQRLRQLGVEVIHGDIRSASDVEALPKTDWVIDAAANPSVLAGVGTGSTSRQLLEHNLGSLFHILEYCKRHNSGLFLLSTSRVYSIPALRGLSLLDTAQSFHFDHSRTQPPGVSAAGIGPDFSTQAPVSLYGSTKLACEVLALEYGEAFNFPVWINRCGVLAGPGQFGKPDQGIFAFWINAHLRRRPLHYIGFDGEGKQVRDALSPHDLATLLQAQLQTARPGGRRIYTVGGGPANAMSLRQLNAWCDARFGPHAPTPDLTPRPYDIPWIIMDNACASDDFGWQPALPLEKILTQIADHARQHPQWLELSA